MRLFEITKMSTTKMAAFGNSISNFKKLSNVRGLSADGHENDFKDFEVKAVFYNGQSASLAHEYVVLGEDNNLNAEHDYMITSYHVEVLPTGKLRGWWNGMPDGEYDDLRIAYNEFNELKNKTSVTEAHNGLSFKKMVALGDSVSNFKKLYTAKAQADGYQFDLDILDVVYKGFDSHMEEHQYIVLCYDKDESIINKFVISQIFVNFDSTGKIKFDFSEPEDDMFQHKSRDVAQRRFNEIKHEVHTRQSR